MSSVLVTIILHSISCIISREISWFNMNRSITSCDFILHHDLFLLYLLVALGHE